MSDNLNQKPQTNALIQGTEGLIRHILASDAELFHDQYNEPHIAYNGDGSDVAKINTSSFKRWLHHYYWTNAKAPLPKDAGAIVADTLAGYACFEGERYILNVRNARQDNYIWYDLGDGTAVCVSQQGWKVVTNPPILFRRWSHQKSQVHPDPEGDINVLRAYVNMESDDDWLLFMTNLIASFVPGFPHPLLVLYGPQGAGKSTPMRIMKELADPSQMHGQTMPTDIPEFIQLASHHAIMIFDNLSSLSTKMSDALARAATGDSFSKRMLYTNDDDVIYHIQKPISINGIGQVIFKPDLLDRSILIKLKRIATEQRMPEEDLWEAFNDDHARLLGSIFDVLSKALAILPNVELQDAPRMADFTRWGCAIAEAAGYTQKQFLDAYRKNIDRQNMEAIAASPVAQAIIEYMKNRTTWTGTAANLLHQLNDIAFDLGVSMSRQWPKEPSWMGRLLSEAQPNLASVGISTEHAATAKGRIITIQKDPSFSANSAMPQDDSTAQQDLELDYDTITPITVNPSE